MMNTYYFNEVYVKQAATACGPFEAKGPLKDKFDVTYDDVYCGVDTYELAERKLLSEAVNRVCEKARIYPHQLDIAFGGDLINQLGTSNYFMKDFHVSFVGVYGACSTSVLASILACTFVEKNLSKNAIAYTSSHNATAERQFRYPNEYAVQKPPTTTFTATGAGCILFSNDKTKIKCTEATVGKVIDFDFKNPNDMGSAMAPAAYDTIMTHFKNTNTSFKDYDCIATGDLSEIGNKILIDMFKYNKQEPMGKCVDCGMILYDRDKQEVFSGGSGAACSILVTIAHFFEQLELKKMKRVMIVATGALLSPVLVQQKESIPCIAHAIVYERVDD